MDKLIWIGMALTAGAALPFQGGINTKLGKAAASPLHAAFISFTIGALALLIYILVTKQSFSWAGLKQVPPQYWTGGVLGAFYVTSVILAFPKLGPGLTFGLIVAGQLVISVLLDHFNVMVTQPHALNLGRIAGVMLIVGGVVLLKRF